jgi:hypothetical protein
MVERDFYLNIAKRYGHCASWAIWANEGVKPKSNIGDLTIFDIKLNPNILEKLNPNLIMVGLNISRKIEFTFGNFHDSRPQSQDYKIRYAFRNTRFYGAYMTDIIKDFKNIISGSVKSYLNSNKEFEEQNIKLFKQELVDIKACNPILIAFGNHTFEILNKSFKNEFQIIKVPHYSMFISKENYKRKIGRIILNV